MRILKSLLFFNLLLSLSNCANSSDSTKAQSIQANQEINEILWSGSEGRLKLAKQTLHSKIDYVLHFSGPINLAQANDFESALKLVPLDQDITVSLNSQGGSATGVFGLIDVLKSRKCTTPKNLNCKIITIVQNEAECSSACIFLFTAGDLRLYEPKAKFGFHAQRSFEAIDENGKPIWQIDRGVVEKLLVKGGFSNSWVNAEAVKGTFSTSTITYYSGENLQDSEALADLFPAKL